VIFLPADPFNPPHGRIDGVIYFGAVPMSNVVHFVGWQPSDNTLRWWDNSVWSDLEAAFAPGGVLDGYDGSNLYNIAASGLAAGGAFPAISGANLTSIPASGLAAGGTFPAIDGSALTNLPPPPTLASGHGTFDFFGRIAVTVSASAVALAIALDNAILPSGVVSVANNGGGSWTIWSSAGPGDQNNGVYWIAY